MTATILPFRGSAAPRPRRLPAKVREENRAMHDARLIRAAKGANDDWTARLLLALLQTLSSKQMEMLEFRLLGPELNSESATQALAIVQLAKGTLKHRQLVGHLLHRMDPG